MRCLRRVCCVTRLFVLELFLQEWVVSSWRDPDGVLREGAGRLRVIWFRR